MGSIFSIKKLRVIPTAYKKTMGITVLSTHGFVLFRFGVFYRPCPWVDFLKKKPPKKLKKLKKKNRNIL